MRFQLRVIGCIACAGLLVPALLPLPQTPVFAQTQPQIAADLLMEQGYQQLQAGRWSDAVQSFLAALGLYDAAQNRQGVGQAYGSLGLAYLGQGEGATALQFIQQDLAIARELHNRRAEGQALGNMAMAHMLLEEGSPALEAAEQSLQIAQEVANLPDQVMALGRLGQLYLEWQDYDRSISYFQQAQQIAQQVNPRLAEQVEIGLQLATRRKESEALYLDAALLMIEREAEKAIPLLENALSLAQSVDVADLEYRILMLLGPAYTAQGNSMQAVSLLQRALALVPYSDEPNVERQAKTLMALAGALYNTGNWAEAERFLRESVQIWEEIRADNKAIWEANSSSLIDADANDRYIFDSAALFPASPYPLLQSVLVAQNKPEAALEVAEQARARVLVERLVSRLAQQNASPLTAEKLTITEIQQIAEQQQATLVEYSIAYSTLYIWVVKPTGEVALRQVDLRSLDQPLRDLIADSRQTIGARGRAASVDVEPTEIALQQQQVQQARNLQQLHQLLIAPIADLLPVQESDRIVFVPQGDLYLVPFPALQDPSGAYLIEKHTVSVAPSIHVLALTRQGRQTSSSRENNLSNASQGNALVVGNPTMPQIGTLLAPLPGAEQEARAIATLLGSQALIGEQATEPEVVQRMQQAKIIHLATHGFLDRLDSEWDSYGAVALAPTGESEATNGLLTSSEIAQMALKADLAVLSACDTGRGAIQGDGVIGLSRAFIVAGVPTVVVSLWKVPDQPTALLMTEFYKNLQHTSDKAQALRQAMLTTKQQYPAPLDWAAFMLIGDPE
ncbi:MAG TPA: CHAT domain-containing protein [Leptolyngbyaceae cyanobacterium]